MFLAVMELAPDDLEAAAYLTVGKIAPEFENKELHVGGSTVSASIAEATGTFATVVAGQSIPHQLLLMLEQM